MSKLVGIKLNKRDVAALAKDVQDAIDDSLEDTYDYYKKATPIKLGNARRNTKFSATNKEIKSDYDYAGRLDNGWSKQAPNGFTKQSYAFLKRRLGKLFSQI